MPNWNDTWSLARDGPYPIGIDAVSLWQYNPRFVTLIRSRIMRGEGFRMSLLSWITHPGLWFRRDDANCDLTVGNASGRRMRLVRSAKFGIYVDPEDTLIGAGIVQRGNYEPHVANLISRLLKPGDTFLDLGSNIGYHTLTAAKRVGRRGRCIAVDLNPVNCALLKASCDFNGFSQVEIHEKAAAAESGTLSFFTTPNTGNSTILSDSLRPRMPGEPQWFGPTEQRVPAIAVDDLVGHGPLHLVKMDVEGSEAGAIAGMKRILSEQRPKMIFEFFPLMLRQVGEIEPFDLLDTIRGFGYAIFRLGNKAKVSKEPLSNADAMPKEGEVLTDLFAIPR
jgi:FkbM family methyltransferase